MDKMELDSDFDFGISDDEILRRFKEAIRIDTERRNVLGVPTARYDADRKKVYYEYPDGRREYEQR